MKSINEYLITKNTKIGKNTFTLSEYIQKYGWNDDGIYKYFLELNPECKNRFELDTSQKASLISFNCILSKFHNFYRYNQIVDYLIFIWNILSDAGVGTDFDDKIQFIVEGPSHKLFINEKILQKEILRYIYKAANNLCHIYGGLFVTIELDIEYSNIKEFRVVIN